MTSERTHLDVPVAVEETGYAGATAPVDGWRSGHGQRDASPTEELSAISMSASLLALNGVLVGGTLAAAPAEHVGPVVPRESRHPSICLAKRVFDVLFATVALLSFLPVLVACAIALKLESAGPLLFRQRRLGTNGVPFQILKFR